jgi:hypothetical protein
MSIKNHVYQASVAGFSDGEDFLAHRWGANELQSNPGVTRVPDPFGFLKGVGALVLFDYAGMDSCAICWPPGGGSSVGGRDVGKNNQDHGIVRTWGAAVPGGERVDRGGVVLAVRLRRRTLQEIEERNAA